MSVDSNKFHLIGKVHSSQGVRGQVFVILKAQDTPWMGRWKTLHLSPDEVGSCLQTYPITQKKEHAKQGKQGFVLTLETIKDKDAADLLAQQFVWIPKEFLKSQKGESIYLLELENFMVVDKQRGEVGPVVGFASNGPQDLIEIQTASGKYLVPLVKPFIEKIDFEGHKLFMDIPMGLLEDGDE